MAEFSQELTTVIVSWNVRDILLKNLEALSGEVIVIDNASTDGTAAAVASKFPNVRLIENPENIGFSKACNQGIRAANGKHVLLLNPDMLVGKDTLAKTAIYLDAHPEVGVIGAKLIGQDGKPMHHLRRFPRLSDQLVIFFKLNKFFPRVMARYMGDDLDLEKQQNVDSIRGSFFAINRTALEKIGLLDERFFIWFEEVDYCKRVYQAGMEVRYVPDIVAHDLVGKSFVQRNKFWKRWQFTKSLVKYFLKWL